MLFRSRPMSLSARFKQPELGYHNEKYILNPRLSNQPEVRKTLRISTTYLPSCHICSWRRYLDQSRTDQLLRRHSGEAHPRVPWPCLPMNRTLYETESGLFERRPSISFVKSAHDLDTSPKYSGVYPKGLNTAQNISSLCSPILFLLMWSAHVGRKTLG